MSKFKIIKDYQLTTEDKKIIILKAKVFIENYVYVNKDVKVKLDPQLVENNPDYFQFIDWKTDLVNYLKTNKIATPSVIAKKLYPYIEDNFLATEVISMVAPEPEVKAPVVDSLDMVKKLKQSLETTDQARIDAEKLAENYKAKNDILETRITDTEKELDRVTVLLNEKSKGVDAVEKSYKEQLSKLELELSNTKLSKSEYSKEVEEEMISKLKEVNERLEAVIKREGEVRTAEMDANNTFLHAKELKDRNTLIVLDIDSREKTLDMKLNDLAAREKRIEVFDKEKIIEEALSNFEKTIPWQYWRESSK